MSERYDELNLDELVKSASFGGYNKAQVKELFKEQGEKANAQIRELTESLEQSRDTISRLKSSNAEAINNYNELLKNGDTRAEEIKTKKNAEIAELTASLEEVKKQYQDIRNRLLNAEENNQKKLNAIQEGVQANLTNLEENYKGALKKKDDTISDLNQRMKVMRDELNNKQASEASIRDGYEEKLRILGEGKKKAETELNVARTEILEFEKELAEGEYAKLKQLVAAQDAEIGKFKRLRQAQDEQLAKTQSELASERQISNSLRNDISAKEKSIEETRKALDCSQKSRSNLNRELQEQYAKYLSVLEKSR